VKKTPSAIEMTNYMYTKDRYLRRDIHACGKIEFNIPPGAGNQFN